MCAQRVQLKTTIDGAQVPLNPYTDCVKNVRQQMPLAGSKLLGTTVLYVGPQTDKYNTGTCYTCKATESNSYYWDKVQGNADLSVLPTTVRFQSQGINTKGAVLTVDSTGFKFRQDSQGLGCTRLFTAGFGFIRYAGGDLHISTSAVSRVFSISTDAASELSISAGSTLYTEQGKVILPARIGISGVNSQSANAGCVSIYPSCIRDTAMQSGPALSVWQSGVYWDGVALATIADIDTHATLTASSDTLGHIKVDNETITVDENGVATAHAVGHNIFDIFYSMSSKAPAGAMDLSLGTLIASCDTVFPDFWSECLQRRGNAHMFPQFSGDGYYYWSGDSVLGGAGLDQHGNAVCYYEGKIYVLAQGECDGHQTPPPQSQEWRQFIVPTEQWDAQKQYSVGDTVLYNGQIWCARSKYVTDGYWYGIGIAPGTTDANGYHHWALYDLPTQIVAPSIRILTESEWQAEATTNGSCGAFVVDEEAKSVRLPKITNMVQPGDVGVFTEAGLPNITGTATQRAVLRDTTGGFLPLITKSDGVFAVQTTAYAANTLSCSLHSTQHPTPYKLIIDASRVNSIYGNSTTVQPPAVGAKLYIQVFTSAVPASMAQAGEFINMLEAKADRTELENYLPLSGGTMTGSIFTTAEASVCGIDTAHSAGINGGNGWGQGASYIAYGSAHASRPGQALVRACDGTNEARLYMTAAGVMNWTGKYISGANSAGSGLMLYAGSGNFDGATLQMFKRDHGTYAGQFYLRASTKDANSANGTNCDLVGKPNGTLTWGGNTIVPISASSITATGGYIKFANRVLIQWGYATYSGSITAQTVTFKTAFANTTYTFLRTGGGQNTSANGAYGYSGEKNVARTTTTATIQLGQNGTNYSWIAIGTW